MSYVDPFGECYYGADGKWHHDNWEYLGGYERKPDPGYYAGTTPFGIDVYVAPDDNYATPPGSVKVIDNRAAVSQNGEPNPNFQVKNSYKITDRAQQVGILAIIKAYDAMNPSKNKWNRTQWSLIVEWDSHNLFSAFDQSARDTDFDNNEEGCGYTYFIGKAITRGYQKFIRMLS